MNTTANISLIQQKRLTDAMNHVAAGQSGATIKCPKITSRQAIADFDGALASVLHGGVGNIGGAVGSGSGSGNGGVTYLNTGNSGGTSQLNNPATGSNKLIWNAPGLFGWNSGVWS